MTTVFTKRIIAYIMDFFVVSSVMWIISYIISFFFNPYEAYEIYSYFIYIVPFIILIYFAVCEKIQGATVGKALMNIEVLDDRGYSISWQQAIIRNITKIFWFPIIFDWAIGSLMGKRDRLFDIFSYTKVINAPWEYR